MFQHWANCYLYSALSFEQLFSVKPHRVSFCKHIVHSPLWPRLQRNSCVETSASFHPLLCCSLLFCTLARKFLLLQQPLTLISASSAQEDHSFAWDPPLSTVVGKMFPGKKSRTNTGLILSIFLFSRISLRYLFPILENDRLWFCPVFFSCLGLED